MAPYHGSVQAHWFVEGDLDMMSSFKMQAIYVLKIALVLTPMLISMYLLYWLGKYEIWIPETAHRDKITILIVAAGMVLSFLLQSHFAKSAKK